MSSRTAVPATRATRRSLADRLPGGRLSSARRARHRRGREEASARYRPWRHTPLRITRPVGAAIRVRTIAERRGHHLARARRTWQVAQLRTAGDEPLGPRSGGRSKRRTRISADRPIGRARASLRRTIRDIALPVADATAVRARFPRRWRRLALARRPRRDHVMGSWAWRGCSCISRARNKLSCENRAGDAWPSGQALRVRRCL